MFFQKNIKLEKMKGDEMKKVQKIFLDFFQHSKIRKLNLEENFLSFLLLYKLES